jgi:hypothetical protein
VGVVPHRIGKGEEKARAAGTLAPAYPLRTIAAGKTAKIRKTAMTGLIETYRVEAFNTAKLSENKMHDDGSRAGSALRAASCPASTSWPI